MERVACSMGATPDAAGHQDDVRCESDQFHRVFAGDVGITSGPAGLDAHVTTFVQPNCSRLEGIPRDVPEIPDGRRAKA